MGGLEYVKRPFFIVKNKVLFICKGHQNIAGAQLYLQQVTSVFPPDKYDLHYAFQAKDGIRVFDQIEQKRFIQKWEYDWRHLPFIASYRQARVLLSKVYPEFIIFNSNEDEIIPVLLAARVSGIKNKIMVVHWALDENSFPMMVKKGFLPFFIPSRYALKMRLKRFSAYFFLDKLIFVNNGTRKAFIKLYNVNSGKCKTIYNGINTPKFHLGNVRESVREKLGVGEYETMLLATGNLSFVKGHDILISAVKLLVDQGKAIKCFIAGQGELKDALLQKIIECNLLANVQLLGYRDDVPHLLSATDIFVMPSLNEALGYSILEAMAAGKPVVASKVGGIPEVITNGKEGILVTPSDPEALSDAIDLLFIDKKLREKIGAAGVEKVNKVFSVQSMMKQTAEFLEI